MAIGSIKNHQKKIIIILVLTVLVLAVYWQVQNFGFIYYDDHAYVTQNYQLQSNKAFQKILYAFEDTHTGNWHPITMLSHMLDWQIFGEKAGGHHWSSLIIHILNTVLLFLLLNRMTGSLWRSAVVAALFAVHPINVESVAWVAERKNVLSTFFWFLTMLFYVWYVEKPGWKRYLPVVICFALGLMSKPMLVTLPFVLLLMDYWPLNRTSIDTVGETEEGEASVRAKKPGWRFLVLEKVPLFVLTVVSICVTLYTQHGAGAMMNVDSLPFSQRISNAIVSYGMYIKKMFWPFDLAIFYPHEPIQIWKLLSVLSVLILLSVVVIRYCRRHPYLAVGWFWYMGTLVPVIGLVQVGAQSMADRYAYVPLIGLYIMLVWYVADVVLNNRLLRIGLVAISSFIVLALSLICWQQCQLWGNQFALSNDVLKKHHVPFAYNIRGMEYARQGKVRQALADFKSAIGLDKQYAEAFINRANLYAQIGLFAKAFKDYNEAQRLHPDCINIYYNRGLLYLSTGELDEAIVDFTEAININPDMADAYNNRGLALRLKGRYDKAFADLNQALKINSQLAEAYFNRGILYNILRQYGNAVADFTAVESLKPQFTDAYFYRGVSLAFLGRYNDAIRDFQHVTSIDARHVPALNNLGNLLKKMKRYGEASVQYQKVLQIIPDNQNAMRNLKEIENLKRSNSWPSAP